MKKKLPLFLLILYGWQNALAANFTYQINGVADPALTNARARLDDTIEHTAKKNAVTDQQVQQLYRAAPEEIRKALQPYGYFRAQVHSQLNETADGWQAIYQVDPGPVLCITALDLTVEGEGKTDPEITKLFADFPLKVGEPLQTPAYDKSKQKIFDVSEHQGYITATLNQHVIDIDLKKYTAVIHLHLDTGLRYYFGSITFSKTPLADSFLRKFAPFNTGEPYSTDKIISFQDALNNSNYFQQVWIEPQRNEAAKNNYVPIKANLVARPAQQYTLGLGFGTDTGPRTSLGWEFRHVTDTGQRFSALTNLSPVQSSLQALYTIPGNNPVTDQYNISAGVLDARTEQGSNFTRQFGVAHVTNINDWQRTVSLNFQAERFKLERERTQDSHLLIPGISWLKLDANDPIFASKGNRFNLRLQGARQGWLSTTSFIQGEVQDKFIYTFSNKSRVIGRGDFGYTIVHNLTRLSLSQRFSTGGSQSVRGYSYQSLGPGRYLIVGSLEYQHPVKENWYSTIFYDMGNAMDHMNQTLQSGPGVGVLWKSPVGPMELTLAKAISKRGQPIKIQFTMGPDLG